MADARVTSAISHWAPRFVANGVALTDFEEVTAAIARWEDWCAAWSARAAVHEALGREALAREQAASAPASICSAPASTTTSPSSCSCTTSPQMKAAHMKAVECRRLALPHLTPPGERVAIPFEGKAPLRHPAQARGRRRARP